MYFFLINDNKLLVFSSRSFIEKHFKITPRMQTSITPAETFLRSFSKWIWVHSFCLLNPVITCIF